MHGKYKRLKLQLFVMKIVVERRFIVINIPRRRIAQYVRAQNNNRRVASSMLKLGILLFCPWERYSTLSSQLAQDYLLSVRFPKWAMVVTSLEKTLYAYNLTMGPKHLPAVVDYNLTKVTYVSSLMFVW